MPDLERYLPVRDALVTKDNRPTPLYLRWFLSVHEAIATFPVLGGHASTHQPGGADPMAVDAIASVGSLRTLGTGALQSAAGAHTHPEAEIVGLVADLASRPQIVSGSWVPADGSGAALVLTVASATYTKIGDRVFLDMEFTYPATANGTNALITGLPYPIGKAAGLAVGFSNGGIGQVYLRAGTSAIEFYSTVGARLTNANLTGHLIAASGNYRI